MGDQDERGGRPKEPSKQVSGWSITNDSTPL